MKGSKGISLPIEMIVIIAIAVLVLTVIAAFFVLEMGKRTTSISDYDALTRGCTELVLSQQGCAKPLTDVPIQNYNVVCDGQKGNLQAACCRNGYKVYDYSQPNSCQVLACRCPPYSG